MSAIKDNDVLYQVVQPSAWCQLDCSYCGQEHSKKRLSDDHQREFLSRVRERLASGKYHSLKIGWFGAEPIIGIHVIRSLSPSLRKLAEDLGCDYSSRIVTNGVALTPAIAKELLHNYFIKEAEVTLDGLADHHDEQRFTKSGKGSFGKIFANLKAVAATTDMRLTVRCNVSRNNVEGVIPLINMLAEEGLAKSLSFYTSPVYNWGNQARESGLTYEEYADHEMEWLALQLRLGFNVGLIPPRRRIVCMSVHREAEVIDAYGATYNCTEAPYVPSYGKPNIYEFKVPVSNINIRPTSQDSLAQKLRNFNEQIVIGEQQQCAMCPMLPVCGGQCPKSWNENIEPCPSAKKNIKDRLNILFALSQIQ